MQISTGKGINYVASPQQKFPCPICGSLELDGEGVDDSCMVCGWEDADYQRRYPNDTGPNGALTLNDAKQLWMAGKAIKSGCVNPKDAEQ